VTCGDKLWSFRSPFCHLDTIVFDGTQRQIMVILRLLRSRGGELDDMQRKIMVIPLTFSPFRHNRVQWHVETSYGHSAHLFAIQRRLCSMAHRDKLWSFCAFPSWLDRVRWHAETNYGHSVPFCHPEAIVPDDTRRQIMVIRTLLLSVRLDE